MKLPPSPDRLWDLPQVREFVKQAKSRVGEAGWQYLSPEMREALVAQKALEVVAGLVRGDIPCAAIWCLRRDMLLVAGLVDQAA